MSIALRARITRKPREVAATMWRVFDTASGWVALAGGDSGITDLTVGHRTRRDAIVAIVGCAPDADEGDDAWSELCDRLRVYLEGRREDFADVKLPRQGVTSLQQRVYEVCRKIPFGRTMTYGELAAKVGAPGAARFVGNCMARNRVPLIVPCHRVVGSHGALGGYSGVGGLSLKRRLLDLESRA